jgi:EmrB/QacA subfamily drug resistance transporter
MSDAATSNRPRVLVLLCLAEFMIALDFAIMNVMLPSLHVSIGASRPVLQGVVCAYAVMFAGFLLLGGRAADLYGRKRVLVIGLTGFVVASAIAGTAQSSWQVITGRALQGSMAALVTPAAFSLLTRIFSDKEEREKAMGAWGAVLGAGFVCGVVAGGAITEFLGWRWVFYLNLPIGLVLIPAILAFVPNAEADEQGKRLDIPGAVLGTAAVMVLVYSFIKAGTDGWTSSTPVAGLAIALVLALLFVVVERRQEAPLVPARAIRGRKVIVTNLSNAMLAAGFFGLLFMVTLFLQQAMHFGPWQTGLTFAAAGAAGLAAGITSTWFAGRFGTRRPLVVGALIQTGATAALATLPHDSTQLLIAATMIVVNFSGVIALVMINITAMDGVAAEEQGFISGLLVTCEQAGGALGLGLVGAIAISYGSLVGGLRVGVLVAAGLTLAGALTPLLLRSPAVSADGVELGAAALSEPSAA